MKLVRDRIPEICRENGQEPVTHIAGVREYRRRLRQKLTEEVREFLEADDRTAPEELADVLEVVYALARNLDVTAAQLEEIRRAKAMERGGFSRGIVWEGNLER